MLSKLLKQTTDDKKQEDSSEDGLPPVNITKLGKKKEDAPPSVISIAIEDDEPSCRYRLVVNKPVLLTDHYASTSP